MKKATISSLIGLSLFSGAAMAVMDTIPASPEKQATKGTWTQAPYNKWTFRNMGLHPSVMVPRDGDIVAIPEALDPKLAELEFDYQGKTYTVRDAMIGDHTDGYIVVHNGKVLHEEYFGEFTEKDHHMWASSTKSLTGQALGLLVEQGKVDVNAKVETYIEELKGTHFGQRTVREVLNMVTALNYSEDYVNMEPGDFSTEYFRRLGFVAAFDLEAIDPIKDDTPRGLLEFAPFFTQNPDLQPSYKYEYHSPNVDVIGWIISRVSGQPLQTFIAENIWSKLGAEHDAFMMADMTFVAVATGGMNTTLRDFARVGMAMANNGKYNGEQVFSEDWVKDTFALTEEEKLHTARSDYRVDENSPVYDQWLEGYKNYLWVHDSEKGIGSFRGVFGQNLYINQEKNLVIATFSSTPSASNAARETNRPRMAAFEAVANYIK
ncbi:serine hydrolase domain-containing protein [Photobacterium rosenbergii]|uniref:serine hydrolase domain-containing protein n=1 Tax=Photobacterium rosenbergii TaxID=294936 RepID=UPI001C9A2A10|nr:serine hydrolase [Photobacterium rosenbergii]MBY5948450.1 beta-lactamase family protein [Photobacterium rosenbergii]